MPDYDDDGSLDVENLELAQKIKDLKVRYCHWCYTRIDFHIQELLIQLEMESEDLKAKNSAVRAETQELRENTAKMLAMLECSAKR